MIRLKSILVFSLCLVQYQRLSDVFNESLTNVEATKAA